MERAFASTEGKEGMIAIEIKHTKFALILHKKRYEQIGYFGDGPEMFKFADFTAEIFSLEKMSKISEVTVKNLCLHNVNINALANNVFAGLPREIKESKKREEIINFITKICQGYLK